MNTDVAAICRVWNSHFADRDIGCPMDPLRLELCCLAKPYFSANDLLLAEVDSVVVGFAQLAHEIEAKHSATPTGIAVSALCVAQREDEDSIAAELLRHCCQRMRASSAATFAFKPILPNASYFLGFGPGDSMLGVTSAERRTCEWLQAAGFQPRIPTTQWELNLADFRPVVDRTQVQIRRSAYVDREIDEPQLPWKQACILGHAEPTAFHLTCRAERRVLQDVLFWGISPELRASSEIVFWLWPLELSADAQDGKWQGASVSDQLIFLLSESLRYLIDDGVDQVRCVTQADDSATGQLLSRLGFRSIQAGVVFSNTV